jgi:hypothetical protein
MGCASNVAPPAHDAKADNELALQVKRHEALQADFKSAASDYRRRCEIQAGDCRLDVNDGRDRILRQHSSAECRQASDSDAEFACVADKLTKQGQSTIATGYYKLENWCLSRLVDCTAKLSDEARGNAKKLVARTRAEKIESSKRALLARSSVSFAEERAAYLRAMLPPQADGTCADPTGLTRCKSEARSLLSKFDAEIDKDESSYDEARATASYEAMHSAEASCYNPVFEGLQKKLDGFGGTAETRRYMDMALKSLEKRQRLVAERGEDDSKSCLSSGLTQYQGRIVDDYQKFSHEPVLFFQAQLHRDFRALYDTQSGCLQSRTRSGSSVAQNPSRTQDREN